MNPHDLRGSAKSISNKGRMDTASFRCGVCSIEVCGGCEDVGVWCGVWSGEGCVVWRCGVCSGVGVACRMWAV